MSIDATGSVDEPGQSLRDDGPDSDAAQSSLTCFVIGPIGNRHGAHGTPERETYEESLRVMEEVIQPACARLGLTAIRADSLARAGEINEQIFRRLREDDVVIADLTAANPNVMYELGLRHTRDRLTVQIGEFGRLPFDINMIRTIQFSRSAIGLINARDELIQVLEAGIAGEYDPVTATRVWTSAPGGVAAIEAGTAAPGDGTLAAVDDDDRGFLDIMAEAEEQQEKLAPALEAVGNCIGELGTLSEASTAEVNRSDAAGKGMRGRLQAATKHARGLEAIADRLEHAVEEYASVLAAFSAGTLVIIERMKDDPEDLKAGQEFGMLTRALAVTTRTSLASVAELAESIRENARLSRVLREPSRRITTAVDRFTKATSIVDEWDRQLQSLGIPIPPEGWEPNGENGNPPRAAEGNEGAPNGQTQRLVSDTPPKTQGG